MARELKQKRSKIANEMRSIVDNPANNGDLSEEQSKRFDALKAELVKLDGMIERMQIVEDAERRASGAVVTGDKQLDAEMRAFSLQKAVQHTLGVKVDAGRELEISAELARREGRSTEGIFMPYSVFMEKRTPGTITTSGAGDLIGTDHLGGQFIDILREANPLSGLGIRTLSGLVGDVEIPRLATGSAVGWFGENSSISQTEPTFDKITLTPKHVGAWLELSRNMILQSSPDIEGILRRDLASVLGMEVAKAIIQGTGSSNQPAGILANNALQTMATPESAMNYVPELAALLDAANVGKISFLGSLGLKKTVEEMLTTDLLPVGAAAFFRGHPFKWTTLVPSDNLLIAGDFSQVIQGNWGSVELLLNPFAENVFKKGNALLRIILTMDIAIRHGNAFATFDDTAADSGGSAGSAGSGGSAGSEGSGGTAGGEG